MKKMKAKKREISSFSNLWQSRILDLRQKKLADNSKRRGCSDCSGGGGDNNELMKRVTGEVIFNIQDEIYPLFP